MNLHAGLRGCRYLIRFGDFNNFMGSTSKKLLNNILNNFYFTKGLRLIPFLETLMAKSQETARNI